MVDVAIWATFSLTVLQPWMTYKPQPFTGEGSPLRQICYVLLFLVALSATIFGRNSQRVIAIPATLVAALLWCWVSVSWAIQPGISLRRLLLTTLVIWSIFMLVNSAGYTRTIRIARAVLVVTLIANFAAVALFPSFGIHQAVHNFDAMNDPGLAGDWRGILLQKNFAGAICAFTIIMFSFDARHIRPWIRAIVLAAALFFLVMSGSKTSVGIGLSSLLLGLAFTRYDPAYRALLIPITVVTVSAVLITAQIYWDKIVAPLNDQSAFTGRTQIWPPLFRFAEAHPFTGAGYGSFWNIGEGSGPIFEYAKGWILNVTQGHNGYLDLLVTIGVPGLLLVVVAAVILPVAALLARRDLPRRSGALLLSTILFSAGHNLTESSLFDRDTIVQTFLMFAVAMTYNLTRGPRLLQAPVRVASSVSQARARQ